MRASIAITLAAASCLGCSSPPKEPAWHPPPWAGRGWSATAAHTVRSPKWPNPDQATVDVPIRDGYAYFAAGAWEALIAQDELRQAAEDPWRGVYVGRSEGKNVELRLSRHYLRKFSHAYRGVLRVGGEVREVRFHEASEVGVGGELVPTLKERVSLVEVEDRGQRVWEARFSDPWRGGESSTSLPEAIETPIAREAWRLNIAREQAKESDERESLEGALDTYPQLSVRLGPDPKQAILKVKGESFPVHRTSTEQPLREGSSCGCCSKQPLRLPYTGFAGSGSPLRLSGWGREGSTLGAIGGTQWKNARPLPVRSPRRRPKRPYRSLEAAPR